MSKTVRDRIERYVNNPEETDVCFLVGVNMEKMFGHKIFMSSASEYFEQMFIDHSIKESPNEIIIPDFEPPVFLEILRFLYVFKANVTDEILIQLFKAADKYSIDEVKQHCVDVAVNLFYDNKQVEWTGNLKLLNKDQLKDFLSMCRSKCSYNDLQAIIEICESNFMDENNTAWNFEISSIVNDFSVLSINKQ